MRIRCVRVLVVVSTLALLGLSVAARSGAASAPVVRAVSSASGPIAGGTRVTVIGSGFRRVSRVTFGRAAGAHVRVVSARKLKVTTPQHSAGAVYVRVVTHSGHSAMSAKSRFTFVPPGGLWTGKKLPVPAADDHSGELYAMTCTSATACVATGEGGQQTPLIERLAGRTWSGITAPRPTTGDQFGYLYGVSCTRKTACVAVGFATSGGQTAFPVADTLSGKTWTSAIVPITNAVGHLTAVTCLSAKSCIAVGFSGTAGSGTSPLIEQLSGTTWTDTTPTLPASVRSGELTAVSCRSVTVCVAVGYAGTTTRPVVFRLAGTTWTPTKPPLAAADHSGGTLTGVSCTAPSACVAVGSGGTNRPLLETLRGTTWKAKTLPAPAGYAHQAPLTAVSCTSATACTAVGAGPGAGYGPAIEILTGKTWKPAAPIRTGHYLNAVVCRTAVHCVSAGFSSAGLGSPLIETRTN